MAVRWSAAGVPAGERVAAWQEVASGAWVPVDVDAAGEGFTGEVAATAVGGVEVSRIASAAQRVSRTPDAVRRDPGARFFLNLPLSAGASVQQDGRTVRLAPGDFTVVDSARPFELGFARPFGQVSLALPHAALAPRLADPAGVTARRVRGDRGVGAVAAAAIRSLARLDAVDRPTARGLAEHVTGLVALALGDLTPGSGGSHRGLLLQAALDTMDGGLVDVDLAPAVVAAAIGVSTRYLHELFRGHGESFGRTLLRRRLERARTMLADPAQAGRPVADVAAACGFADPSYFARAFKRAHGVTPREARGQDERAGGQDERARPRPPRARRT